MATHRTARATSGSKRKSGTAFQDWKCGQGQARVRAGSFGSSFLLSFRFKRGAAAGKHPGPAETHSGWPSMGGPSRHRSERVRGTDRKDPARCSSGEANRSPGPAGGGLSFGGDGRPCRGGSSGGGSGAAAGGSGAGSWGRQAGSPT
ncbi:hypothetical protein NL676_026254 [Syzygium grande]|nr:hypothetical protein NL676_026254 [Syzygium grande]